MSARTDEADVLLSIVVPAFNEAEALPQTLARIADAVAPDPDLANATEVIVVSDGSTDGTYEAAQEAMGGLQGMVVELAANVGSHLALRCGLQHAGGRWVALVSADGQDPPELLPEMVRACVGGVDVVWGRRIDRHHDRPLTRTAAALYYRLFRRLTGLDFPPSGLDFAVLRRRMVTALLAHRERNASLFLLLFNLAGEQGYVEYERGERVAGTTRWTRGKRIKLAIDMLAGSSTAPIRAASLAGLAVGALGLLFGGVTIVRALLGQVPVSGWASLMVVTSLMTGSLLVVTGLLGEYLWRVLDEVRQRPLYLVRRQTVVPGRPAQRRDHDRDPVPRA